MKAYISLLVLSVIACASAASMNYPHAVQHQSSFDAESQDAECKWIGTAPFCGGDITDCTGSTPSFMASSICGDGAKCLAGSKVFCCPPMILSVLYWKGTAPFCDGKCISGDLELTQSRCGDGNTCWAGIKVLCGRPATVTTAEVEELQKISAYTRESEEEGYKKKKAQLMGVVEPMEPYPDLALAYVNYDMVIENNRAIPSVHTRHG